MNKRITSITISIAATVVIAFFLLIMRYVISEDSPLDRILVLLGGELPEGFIQLITYFLFVFGLMEIRSQSDLIKKEESAFDFSLLPEKDSWVLSPNDVAEIKLRATAKAGNEKYILIDLIKNACLKYRSNKSASEALEVVSAQVRLLQANMESEQSMIRYVAWAIPSVGFIGTIIGIANSLGYARLVGEADGLEKVTNALNVAFDTTLVALFLSIFLVLAYNLFQEKTEKLFSRMEIYIIENLINRIYNR